MSSIFNSIGIDPGYIIIALMILVIVLIVLVIILLTKVKALNTKYTAFMKGKNGAELEQVIYERFGELDIMQQIATQHALEIKNLKRQFRSSYSKMGMVKYDAFKEGCYTYIKEIINGESYIALSEEEKEALKNAINMKDPLAD